VIELIKKQTIFFLLICPLLISCVNMSKRELNKINIAYDKKLDPVRGLDKIDLETKYIISELSENDNIKKAELNDNTLKKLYTRVTIDTSYIDNTSMLDNASTLDNSSILNNNSATYSSVIGDNRSILSTEYQKKRIRYPSWFINPSIDGYFTTGVGSAKPNREGSSYQKRIARAKALAEISTAVSVQVNNEIQRMTILYDTREYRKKVLMISRHRSQEVLKDIEFLDEWTDPETKDYFILLGLKKPPLIEIDIKQLNK